MNNTKTFYYWAIKYHNNWTKDGDVYKITIDDIKSFKTIIGNLLSSKDAQQALNDLPPKDGNISDEYWDDMNSTLIIVNELISNYESGTGSGNIYYNGPVE